MPGFFVIMGYYKDATKRMISMYTYVYPMRFLFFWVYKFDVHLTI